MMIHFAKNELNFNKTNKQKLVVGTQLLNIPSIKLYQSLGLKNYLVTIYFTLS